MLATCMQAGKKEERKEGKTRWDENRPWSATRKYDYE